MITNYNIFLEKHNYSDEYNKLSTLVDKMVDNGDITINTSKDDIINKLMDKDEKYESFGFEALILDFYKNGINAFISEANKVNLAEYIKKFKNKYNIDTSFIEEKYSRYIELDNEITKIDDFIYRINKEIDENTDDMVELNKKYNSLVDEFEEIEKEIRKELVRIAKIIEPKL